MDAWHPPGKFQQRLARRGSVRLGHESQRPAPGPQLEVSRRPVRSASGLEMYGPVAEGVSESVR